MIGVIAVAGPNDDVFTVSVNATTYNLTTVEFGCVTLVVRVAIAELLAGRSHFHTDQGLSKPWWRRLRVSREGSSAARYEDCGDCQAASWLPKRVAHDVIPKVEFHSEKSSRNVVGVRRVTLSQRVFPSHAQFSRRKR